MKKIKVCIKKKQRILWWLFIFAAFVLMIFYIIITPQLYLSNKYNSVASDYKIEKFIPGHISYDVNSFDFEWKKPYWVFNYNDREFNVVSIKCRLYDDYQLEDLEIWLLDEFQGSIDDNIDCINIDSNCAFGKYNEETKKLENILWTRENCTKSLANNDITFFVKKDNISNYYYKNSKNNNYDVDSEYIIKKINNSYSVNSVNIVFHQKDINLNRLNTDSFPYGNYGCIDYAYLNNEDSHDYFVGW